MGNDTNIHAHAVDGAFKIQSINNKSVVSFNATAINRFSVTVAYLMNGFWRARCRFVVTLQDGLLCFPLHSTIENRNGVIRLSKEFDINTALIIGIATTEEKSEMKLRIYANQSGYIENDFNGYEGSVTFDKFLDKVLINNTLIEQKYGNAKRFDRKLYKSNQQHQPAHAQHVNSNES